MNPSGPRKYRKIAPDCGCRPGPISISTSCSTRKCQFLNTSSMVSTWKFMWHRPGLVAAEDGELVVHRVDPHQAGRVAEPVRDPGVEARAPEPVGLVHVRRVQAEVAELGDPGGAAEGHRPGHRLLLVHQLEPVAERVVEGDELAHPPGPGFGGRAAVHADAGPLELGLGGVERVRVGHGETRGDDPGGALDQGQAVVPVVGAQVGDADLGGRHQLEADDAGGEAGRRVQVRHPGSDVGDVGERDHRAPRIRRRPEPGRCRSASRAPGRRRRPGCRSSGTVTDLPSLRRYSTSICAMTVSPTS